MTKRVFTFAAGMVAGIVAGSWTDEPPAWADRTKYNGDWDSYVRAVQTAEAFIMLFRAFNPLFDEKRFLVACGLVDAPAKGKRKA